MSTSVIVPFLELKINDSMFSISLLYFSFSLSDSFENPNNYFTTKNNSFNSSFAFLISSDSSFVFFGTFVLILAMDVFAFVGAGASTDWLKKFEEIDFELKDSVFESSSNPFGSFGVEGIKSVTLKQPTIRESQTYKSFIFKKITTK